MIRITYSDVDGKLETDVPAERLAQIIPVPTGAMLWVDILGDRNADVRKLLEETFKFHPLAVEDAMADRNLPKVDDWGTYLYLMVRTVVSVKSAKDNSQDSEKRVCKLDVFKGRHLLITIHRHPINGIDREWDLCQKDQRHMSAGAGKLLYHVLDSIADDFTHHLDKIDERIDNLEEEIFGMKRPGTVESIFDIKRKLVDLRRTLCPQRDVLHKLAYNDYTAIDPKFKMYFADVYDHMLRLHEQNEGLRDLATSCMDIFLTVNAQRTNDKMKVLAIVTMLFAPLSFLVGFWGMNFFEPSPNTPWCTPTMLWVVLGISLGIPIAIYFWMKRHHWI